MVTLKLRHRVVLPKIESFHDNNMSNMTSNGFHKKIETEVTWLQNTVGTPISFLLVAKITHQGSYPSGCSTPYENGNNLGVARALCDH